MVNSCSILTALLVVGSVVLAVPIVPEGIVSTGMPEGGTYVYGYFIMTSSDFLRFWQQSDLSQEAEAWVQNPANPVSQSEPNTMKIFRADPHLLKAGLAHNHQGHCDVVKPQEVIDLVENYHPLPQNYRQIMDQNNRMMRSGLLNITADERTVVATANRKKIRHIYNIITDYIREDGPSGTSPEKLARIRDGFEKGENLDKLADIMKSSN
ncbi:hypothetical protein EV368DRAFT_89218 [Lentinula lateritia]|uniref:Uncharacterized protein n=1 Tax=Lentinula aff. lateritia TaxID=2804960 RepID=A0ACC1U1W4_9AGAR|nr:hypothetical protein F5876DRAFT_76439 [Lentinula aff. lateritia]KAJ3846320.1 hypothetical protein EV368DRAFT_89218 [Lentinula lateritia]